MSRNKIGGREGELYRVAAFLFNKYGYASTSVRQICRTLGIRESSLYNYVRSKEELLYNICEQSLLQGMEMIRPLAKLKLRPDLKLQKMIETHIRIISSTTNEQSTMLKELRSLSTRNQRKIIKLRDEYQALFRGTVAKCIHEGLLPKVPVKIATLALLGMMNWLIHWYSPEGPMKRDGIARIFSDLFFQRNPTTKTQARKP
jgi:AcrR family transcriptional regulator